MNTCYTFTGLLLAHLTAIIDCKTPLTNSKGDGNITQNATNLAMNLSQPFTDVNMSFTNKTYSSCSVTYFTTVNANARNAKCVNITMNCTTCDVSSQMLCPGNWSACSNYSECLSSGEQYKNQFQCLQPSNSSSLESQNCKPNVGDEKRYTLTAIILVAFGCLVMGFILSALLFILYMKRTQQGCFSKTVKEAQVNSNQQSGPDLQFLTENVVVKKYGPEKPESADPKNENKSDDTKYQSLSSNRIDIDQQPYDKLQLKEIRFDHRGNELNSGRLNQTGNDEQTDQMTNLPHKTEGVYEYASECDRGGHNYFILENENILRESKVSNLGRPEIYAKVGDEVRDSTLETQAKSTPDADFHLGNG